MSTHTHALTHARTHNVHASKKTKQPLAVVYMSNRLTGPPALYLSVYQSVIWSTRRRLFVPCQIHETICHNVHPFFSSYHFFYTFPITFGSLVAVAEILPSILPAVFAQIALHFILEVVHTICFKIFTCHIFPFSRGV